MTAYDAAMAAVIAAGMVWGALRGITWQVASLASLVLGYSVSHPLSGRIAPYLPGEPVVARAVGMIVVYFAVSGGVFVAAWLVRATLRRLKFEAYDRHLGMVLGGLEGALLGLVVTLFVVSLAPQTRGAIFASPTGKVVGHLMAAVGPVLPAEARNVLAPFWADAPAAGDTAEADPPRYRPAPEMQPGPGPLPEPLPEPEPLPDPRRERRPVAARRPSARGAEAGAPGAGSDAPSLADLIERGEERIGKAIADGAAEGFRRAAAGSGAGVGVGAGAGANGNGAAQRR